MTKTPLHVIGAGRGGTSLLFALLDAHPDCEMVGEKISAKALLSGYEDLDPVERVKQRVTAFVNECQITADLSHSMIWGHKSTTEHVLALRETDLPDEFMPERFFVEQTRHMPTVFIVRDGRTCVLSKVNRTGQPIERAIARWKFSIKMLSAYRELHPNVFVVTMENLVLKPADTMRAVCDFVGMKFSENMLSGTTSDRIRAEYRQSGFNKAAVQPPAYQPWMAGIADELRIAGYSALLSGEV